MKCIVCQGGATDKWNVLLCVSGRRDRQVKCIVVCVTVREARQTSEMYCCVSGRHDRQVKCVVMCVREARQSSEMYCYVCQGSTTDK